MGKIFISQLDLIKSNKGYIFEKFLTLKNFGMDFRFRAISNLSCEH